MNDDTIIAAMIRKLRRDREVSQAEIAQILNLPQTVVSRIELSRRRVTLTELRLICEHLQVPLLEFVSEYQDRVRKTPPPKLERDGPSRPG